MWKNYLKISIRNLARKKLYSFINILGLSLGMACAILLFLYIQDELSYDRFYKKSKQIFQVESLIKIVDFEINGTSTPDPMAFTMVQDFPEVIQATKINESGSKLITYKNKKLYQDKLLKTDSTYFEVFDHTFLFGNPQTALQRPYSIVLTRSTALKVFGRLSLSMGKVLKLDNKDNYTVTGIIEDVPKNTHQPLSGLLSYNNYQPEWDNFSASTYLLLKNPDKAKNLEKKFPAFEKKYFTEMTKEDGNSVKLSLRPLTDIHLYGADNGDKTSRVGTIWIFSAIAVFILLIACINYMNLATARSSARAKEIGIRKVIGSHRSQLIMQFLTESLLLSFFALFLSICLVELLMPFFNQVADKDLQLGYFTHPDIWFILFAIAVSVGIISGSYPAFLLSGFKPVLVLKGKFSHSKKGVYLRKSLVIVQFTISVMMITGTWVVYQQMTFMKNKDLGYNQNQVLAIRIQDDNLKKKIPVIKRELLKNPKIESVSAVAYAPGSGNTKSGYQIEDKDGKKKKIITNIYVDHDYLDMMQIKLLQGRNFSRKMTSDTAKAILVNEKLVKEQGWKNPLNQQIGYSMNEETQKPEKFAKVVGVFRDFHLSTLYQPIEPMILWLSPNHGERLQVLLIRMHTEDLTKTKTFIEKAWADFDKIYPMESYFLDQNFARHYRDEERRGQILLGFSILTILIACLGLFGLASFSVEQRTKEIGIRKVLGASAQNILKLISKEFIWLIGISVLIGCPFALYMMNRWLQDFAYKTQISPLIFIWITLLALLIALLTISFHAMRAIHINPVEVLKDE